MPGGREADAGASGLVLVPVGVGAAYARPGEAQSAYLVRAGRRAVLIDMGSGALSSLMAVGQTPESLDAILITHRHPDHCVDLISLYVYLAFGAGRGHRIRVIGPPGLRERLEAFTSGTRWDDVLAFEEWAPGEGALDLGDGLSLRHREVPHEAPTNAVRLERGGRSLCFSADCGPGPDLPALAGGCDLLLCECTFGEQEIPDGVPHLNAEAAAAMASAAAARRLLLTHVYPEIDRHAALAVAAAGYSGPTDWARQGEAVVV